MRIDVDIRGIRRTLALRRAGDGWDVTLDGRRVAVEMVEAAPGGDRWALRIAGPAHDAGGAPAPARSHDVVFGARGADAADTVVLVDGIVVSATIADPRAARRRGPGGGPATGGQVAVTAPMPGRVVRVLVEPGMVVLPRQPLVVVEAMKMENDLRAPRAGVVREVHAAEGRAVEAGTVLVVIDPS